MLLLDGPHGVASALVTATEWMHLALDAACLAVIGLGASIAIAKIPSALRGRRRFTDLRLDFARYLALALEFQLASDVLQTAIAPNWNELGTLAAIAAIRTVLNFVLGREMAEERRAVTTDGARDRSVRTAA